ncbi:MFS general substrate transporter [Mycena floridula]|nr:MFS general substrate transporter [Mycena floridula]
MVDDVKMEEEKAQIAEVSSVRSQPPVESYRLYKRRFVGLTGLVLLNLVGGMSWPWFGPISNNVAAEFGFSLDRVNWLGNIVSLIYLPVAIFLPHFVRRFGVRRCCDVGSICLILSSWVRYSSTARTLPVNGSYGLLIFGQLFSSIAQPIFQILGPKYSENWFDLKGRTTATMIVSIANPVGGALGQLLSPIVGDTRKSILVLAIVSTAAAPFVLLIGDSPPTPPSFAASTRTPSIWTMLREWLGSNSTAESHMTRRERFDFAIVALIFGVLVSAANSFSILSAQILQPAGYPADISGLMGACLLLSGVVAAIITAPLFDRVFTHHLAITAKILVPIVAIAWTSLIWAVKPDNTAGLFVIMALIGVSSLTMLPVGLELGVELTRNAEGSSSILWFSGNLFCTIFILCDNALRASESATPPLNMRRGLIFNSVFILVSATSIFLLRGTQRRKERDEEKLQQSIEAAQRLVQPEAPAAQPSNADRKS